jgi:8-oxo-dGTP diphosphatase
MAREPVLAAGGIVLRRQQPPLIAVVRLRKRDEWVLPKGKLDDGETPRAAARREVLEETGHNVTVHEFLGTLAYDAGGRSKIVHYWRMEAGSEQAHELMHDVRAVDWLPLGAAVERLSRSHEQAFLANVGPQALASFAARRQKPKAPAPRKGREQPAVVSKPAPVEVPRVVPAPRSVEPVLAEPVLVEPMATPPLPEMSPAPVALAESAIAAEEAARAAPPAVEEESVTAPIEEEVDALPPAEGAIVVAPVGDEADALLPEPRGSADAASMASSGRERRSLAQKVRDWLSRAA